MRITKSDFVADQKFDLRKLSVLIAGFTLSAVTCSFLFFVGAGGWSAWGCLMFLPALWKYKNLHDAQRNGLRAFIEKNILRDGVVKYSGKGSRKEVSEIRCPSCKSRNFVKRPVHSSQLIAAVHCEQCSQFLYNTTT